MDVTEQKRARDELQRSRLRKYQGAKRDQLYKENLAAERSSRSGRDRGRNRWRPPAALRGRAGLRGPKVAADGFNGALFSARTGTGKGIDRPGDFTKGSTAGPVGPFVSVKLCPRSPPSLIASETFGHERGAFPRERWQAPPGPILNWREGGHDILGTKSAELPA